MRQAADVLGIGQPSISRQLRALERSVGGDLFLRQRGRKAIVSTLGAALLRDARETLQHHNRLRRKTEEGATECPVIFVRPFLLGQIKKNMSMLHDHGVPRQARFTVVDGSADVASLVEAQEGSVGIIRTDSFPANDNIICMLIRSDSGSLYCAPELAKGIKGEADVRNLDILVPAQQPGLEAYTSRLLARAGIHSERIKLASQFIELVLEEVLGGGGAAVFFDDTVKDLVEEGRLVRLLAVSEPHNLVLLGNKSTDERLLTSVRNAFSQI